MGCVESRSNVNDLNANIFQVEYISGTNLPRRNGRLEVTSDSIVYHAKNRPATRWPLRCLRRYGFDGEKFSFESGRRCPTGPAIFLFKCRSAEELFNTLQNKIQLIAEESGQHQSGRVVLRPEEYLTPIAVGTNNSVRPNSSFSGPFSNYPITESIHSRLGMSTSNQLDGSSSFPRNSANGPRYTPVVPVNGTLYAPNASSLLGQNNLNQTTELGRFIPPPASMISIDSSAVGFDPNSVSVCCQDQTVSFTSHAERSTSHAGSLSDRLSSNSPTANEADNGQMICGPVPPPPAYMNDPVVTSEACSPIPSNEHVYMNIGHENRKDLGRHVMASSMKDPLMDHRLSLYDVGTSYPLLSAGANTRYGTNSQHTGSTVNYIMVDVDKSSDSTQGLPFSPIGSVTSAQPDSPPTRLPNAGYTTIDFERTAALLKTTEIVKNNMNGGRHSSIFSADINLQEISP